MAEALIGIEIRASKMFFDSASAHAQAAAAAHIRYVGRVAMHTGQCTAQNNRASWSKKESGWIVGAWRNAERLRKQRAKRSCKAPLLCEAGKDGASARSRHARDARL
ncbi:hypothetical protein [Paraburkholderia sp. 2C]